MLSNVKHTIQFGIFPFNQPETFGPISNVAWHIKICRNPTLKECEDNIHTLKMGTWESSETLKNLEFDCRGQNTSPWRVLYTIEKLLKCRCRKWPRMSHSDICSTSYGQKKGWKSNCQFDSRPLKVGNPRCVQVECDTPLEISQRELQVYFRPHLNQRFKQGVMNSQSPRSPNRDSSGTPLWGVPKKRAIRM
jgi:hypothetical protein